MSLAIKTSISLQSPQVMKESLQTLCHLHSEMKNNKTKEVIMRSRKDTWIACRSYADKELYIIFEQKNATLTDVQESLNSVAKILFNSSK